MESKITKKSKREIIEAMAKLTPQERVLAFIALSKATFEIYKQGLIQKKTPHK